jgi:hypothetical protein
MIWTLLVVGYAFQTIERKREKEKKKNRKHWKHRSNVLLENAQKNHGDEVISCKEY